MYVILNVDTRITPLPRIFSQMAASSGYKPNLMFDEVRDFSVSPPFLNINYLNNVSYKPSNIFFAPGSFPPPHFLNGLDIPNP